MHTVSEKNPDDARYHPLAVHKTAEGKIDLSHQVSSQKYNAQAEVFPLQKGPNDFKFLQRAYAEEPSPGEYLRLMHGVFGIQSEPFCLRSTHYSEVFL